MLLNDKLGDHQGHQDAFSRNWVSLYNICASLILDVETFHTT